MTTTTPAAPRTKTIHRHWCPAATGKNRRQDAPDATCQTGHQAISCATIVMTAVKVRTFKSHPGQVKVTWDAGCMSWEQA